MNNPNQLNEIEDLINRYYRRDPGANHNTAVNEAVDVFNAMVDKGNTVLDATYQDLAQEGCEIDDLKAEIDLSNKRLNEKADPSGDEAVAIYNQMIADHNELIERYKERVTRYNENQHLYNEKVKAEKEEMARQKKELEAIKDKAAHSFNDYTKWIEAHGPEQLWNNLNRLYASLYRGLRKKEYPSEETESLLTRVKDLRDELGRDNRARQGKIENGFLIVQGLLGPSVDGWFLVDTGASTVSITQELLDVLGLTGSIGEEIEVTLAGGIQIKAPQIVLPRLSVQGMEAKGVDAIVLKESQIGVDGCLGLSFLNRFDFKVQKERPQKLILHLLSGSPPQAPYDTFISHKDEDYTDAKSVYDVLKNSNYHPFLSKVSLEEAGITEYQKGIDEALEAAQHLVVIASSRKNIEASWVESEWRFFIGMKREGKKTGNVITILCGNMTVEALPATLRQYQAISINVPDWKSKLRRFLPNARIPMEGNTDSV